MTAQIKIGDKVRYDEKHRLGGGVLEDATGIVTDLTCDGTMAFVAWGALWMHMLRNDCVATWLEVVE